ncbi:response regulator [Alkalimonas collagenimarina]|uniref:Response regulator n=1 Tax=Alkalimonas collagenimarina TaxID=400390 RepID=A0ABT9GWV0_9GAMM|nr:response regulator [Alkalimonas collagenimarina]MDP4535344.1 response regulator [Alkalimonas collagenimarina]
MVKGNNYFTEAGIMLKRSFNVLVVDDVVLMCDFLHGAVNRLANCRAIKALDGKTALDVLETETIDMLITDLEIKAPDGLELIKRIRSGTLPTAHDIPIIIFSGNAYLEQVQQGIAYDVNDFLVKPMSIDALGKKVSHFLVHDKFIQPAVHYEAMYRQEQKQPKAPEKGSSHKISASIVLNDPQKKDEYKPAQEDVEEAKTEEDFLSWPDNSTTGIYQLDRRLKKLAFDLSCFHNVFVKNCKLIALETERKRACGSIDYLNYIVKNLKKRERRLDFWQKFDLQLSKLNKLAAQLQSANLRHNSLILDLLKKLSYWWSQTISRPLVQRIDDGSEKTDE